MKLAQSYLGRGWAQLVRLRALPVTGSLVRHMGTHHPPVSFPRILPCAKVPYDV